MFVRHAGDEASLIIGFGNVAAIVLERLVTAPLDGLAKSIKLLDTIVDYLSSRNLAKIGATLMVWSVISIIAYLNEPDHTPLEFVIAGLIYAVLATLIMSAIFLRVHVLIIWFIAYALSSFMLVPIVMTSALLMSAALGWELGLASIWQNVSVEACPHGSWQIAHVALDDTKDAGGLQHSRVYSSPVSLLVIRTWIERIANN